MSAESSTSSRISRWHPSSQVTVALIVLVAFACTLTLRYLGAFQFLEFHFYDFYIRQQARAASSEPLVLVEMVESDIQSPSLDYPLPDEKLADLLSLLEADAPAVIGLDIWRDLPVPKIGRAHV